MSGVPRSAAKARGVSRADRRLTPRCLKCRTALPTEELLSGGGAIFAFFCPPCRHGFATPHEAELFVRNRS